MSEWKTLALRGAEIKQVFEPLAALRIAVFRDFPYLYEGTAEYEKAYLQTYFQSPDAFLFSVWHGERMVGATTCIPLTHETEEVKAPFEKAGYDLSTICYLGESILLNEYRGRGLGRRFFDEREAHARSLHLPITCFCAVQRPENHPRRPANYRPLDAFWISRGYVMEPELVAQFSWTDIGSESATFKPMTFWIKR
jgi:GNAT superfamily N-acetyltransferase